MEDLASLKCIPCHGGVPRLRGDELKPYLDSIKGWEVIDDHHLIKSYKFSNFQKALDLVNKIGTLAEEEGHHPDICFGWGYAEIKIYTHAIDGISESDLILAAKIDKL
jgi:4a-hydroxytetrahydrobiopterin dehydratase